MKQPKREHRSTVPAKAYNYVDVTTLIPTSQFESIFEREASTSYDTETTTDLRTSTSHALLTCFSITCKR